MIEVSNLAEVHGWWIMSKVQALIYALFIALEVFGTATLIEIYKKKLRKDKSKKWENILIAGVLSGVDIVILILLNIFKPILGLIEAPIWADYALYFVGFYYFQKMTDMRIVKKLIRSCAKSLLQTYGFSEEQIELIFTTKDSKN